MITFQLRIKVMINPEWLQDDWSRMEQCDLARSSEEFLCVTRFNNKTYIENKGARKRLKYESLYCNQGELHSFIKKERFVYVLEMNIEENKIMGIGRILNVLNDTIYRVYDDDFYNEKHFHGNYRVDANEMNEEEKAFMKELEALCFRGKHHLKRGNRMTCFPWKIIGLCLYHNVDIISVIRKMFLRKYVLNQKTIA